jgi:serine/threonine protein kinase/flagellar basal body-associated protein FliL
MSAVKRGRVFMNADALIGTVLGTCTLQRLVGQGGMGAVFLAQQSRPRRQVAVKVLLPMTPLSPNQLVAFLERFRRETDAAASLEHPNITPVHEYGEQDGLAYLVMPYISGGTLRDELEREGPLPLGKVANYLEQIAAALDFAHKHGVIHRDIKPANILKTQEGRLLLTDFGLVKIVTSDASLQVRLTGAGAPVGTPDYMAPEQVIGEEVDARADLYSLGVILYQMVTGTTPFQGETPMQIAAQHLQAQPPAPQMFRPDLPMAVEQVILRSLAKRPSERYLRAEDLSNAFNSALASAGIQVETNLIQGTAKFKAATGRFMTPRGLFDPAWQTSATSTTSTQSGYVADSPETGGMPATSGEQSMKLPAANQRGGLLSRSTAGMSSLTGSSVPIPAADGSRPTGGSGLLSRTGKFPLVGLSGTGQFSSTAMNNALASSSSTAQPATEAGQMGMLNVADALTASAQIDTDPADQTKLTGPVKVLQLPVAGQPGHYVTGILPVPQQEGAGAASDTFQKKTKKQGIKPWKVAALIALVVILIAAVSGGAFLVLRSHVALPFSIGSQTPAKTAGAPDAKATAQAVASATATANVILSDPLDHNMHNWLTNPPDVYAFKDGAYHITDKGDNGRATVLQADPVTGPLGYTLTMEQVNGTASDTNSFGMLFRFSQKTQGGKTVTTFYSFEVVNTKGGSYQFWAYNDGDAKAASPWKKLWSQPFGAEFHQGQGANATNTFKVFMNGNNFTFTVNGKMVKTTQDNMLKSGQVGMIVNQNGTEVAFKNLLLTRN